MVNRTVTTNSGENWEQKRLTNPKPPKKKKRKPGRSNPGGRPLEQSPGGPPTENPQRKRKTS